MERRHLLSARVTDLRTIAPVLLPASTVFNDGVADTLTGGADTDWFFGEATDINDSVAGERADIFS